MACPTMSFRPPRRAYAVGRYAPTVGRRARRGAPQRRRIRGRRRGHDAGGVGRARARRVVGELHRRGRPRFRRPCMPRASACARSSSTERTRSCGSARPSRFESEANVTDTSGVTAALSAAATAYFNGRPDWYTWRTAALRAALTRAHPAIRACTSATVIDAAPTSDPLSEPTCDAELRHGRHPLGPRTRRGRR